MTTLTDQELMVLHQGIVSVNLNRYVMSASGKIQAELEARGYKIKYVELPKRPYQKKSQYEYQYEKQ